MIKPTLLFAAFIGWLSAATPAHAKAEMYLFYNAAGQNLDEIEISSAETARAFDDIYGPATDEIPDKVRFQDFYVAKFPDQSYVFTLKSGYNCGLLGCATTVYNRDTDGDLVMGDSGFPVKCKSYDSDKILCIKGGYQPTSQKAAKHSASGQKIIHYYAPPEK